MQHGEGVFEIIPVPSAILVISKTTSKKEVIEIKENTWKLPSRNFALRLTEEVKDEANRC